MSVLVKLETILPFSGLVEKQNRPFRICGANPRPLSCRRNLLNGKTAHSSRRSQRENPKNRKLIRLMYKDLQAAYRFFRFGSPVGQKIAWLFFCATCLHTAFLVPNIYIIPGEPARVFSGLLCALTLGVCWICVPRARAVGSFAELTISVILAVLTVSSSLLSLVPASSSARACVILSSGLGGFWSARILLADETGQRIFRILCEFILAGLICVSLICYLVYGNVFWLLDVNPHPLVSRMLLLWFAPLSYLISWGTGSAWVSGSLFVSSYVVFYLSGLRSACLIPLALLFLAAALKMAPLRYLLVLLIPLFLVLIVFFHQLPESDMGLEFEPAYYRAENYFFSWHIAAQHPLLGIGLRAPRDEFLEEYQIRYPYVTKERFADSVKKIRTSENVFLSFLAEVGSPFTILYIFALAVLVTRLTRQVGKSAEQAVIHPVALLMPILAGLLHFLAFDGLYHPQVSWFFHILLGILSSWMRMSVGWHCVRGDLV